MLISGREVDVYNCRHVCLTNTISILKHIRYWTLLPIGAGLQITRGMNNFGTLTPTALRYLLLKSVIGNVSGL